MRPTLPLFATGDPTLADDVSAVFGSTEKVGVLTALHRVSDICHKMTKKPVKKSLITEPYLIVAVSASGRSIETVDDQCYIVLAESPEKALEDYLNSEPLDSYDIVRNDWLAIPVSDLPRYSATAQSSYSVEVSG